MLRRVILAALLVAAGAPMLESPETTLPGVFLVAIGLAVLLMPAYIRRSRA